MGHHYVPQRYLRGFRDPTIPDDSEKPHWIWMYDKVQGTCKCLPISKVAQEPSFYEQAVEEELNHEVEIPGNNVIDKLDSGAAFEEIDRRNLSYYIATMMARVPAARARGAAIAPAALDEVSQHTKDWIKEAARAGMIDDATMTARLAEAETLIQRFKKEHPKEVTDIIERPWPYESWLTAIYNMNWRVLRTDGPSFFLTSDNPITPLNGEGLGMRICELTFPLKKELMLHCSWQGEIEFERLPARPEFVKECNRRTAFGAHRFVFYHQNAPWVHQLASNKGPRLNRVNW